MKNFDLKAIPAKLEPINKFLQRFKTSLFILSMLIIFGFMVARIGYLTNAEPSEEAVSERLKEVKRTKIDQDIIDKIQQLQDQNILIQTLFEQARDNPFKD